MPSGGRGPFLPFVGVGEEPQPVVARSRPTRPCARGCRIGCGSSITLPKGRAPNPRSRTCGSSTCTGAGAAVLPGAGALPGVRRPRVRCWWGEVGGSTWPTSPASDQSRWGTSTARSAMMRWSPPVTRRRRAPSGSSRRMGGLRARCWRSRSLTSSTTRRSPRRTAEWRWWATPTPPVGGQPHHPVRPLGAADRPGRWGPCVGQRLAGARRHTTVAPA